MQSIRLDSRRDGFALPMAILLVGFVTAGLVAAFGRQSAERATVDSAAAQSAAFAIAEAGLESYLAAGTTSATTATYTYTKGTATVTATQIRASTTSTDSSVWLVTSTGVTSNGTLRNPAARRTVAQLAYKVAATMNVLSSWTSLSGIDKDGAAGSISGTDGCGTGVVKAGATEPSGGFVSGKTGPFAGDPAIDTTRTQDQLAAAVKIDWAGITSTSAPAIAADIIYCKEGTVGYDAARTPCGDFPASEKFTDDYWPTIVINGSSALPADGHGMLIVTGNLTLGGGDSWAGVILVGGTITDNGNGGISGAVVTGLNVLLNLPVDPSTSLAHGTKDYQYNSCSVASATNAMAKLNPAKNAWMDNYSAW
jgi:hypothetical protein